MKHAGTIIGIMLLCSTFLPADGWAGGHRGGGSHGGAHHNDKHHHGYDDGWYAGALFWGAPAMFGAVCRPYPPPTVVIQQTWVYPSAGPGCSTGYYYESSGRRGPYYPGAFGNQPVYYYDVKESVR